MGDNITLKQSFFVENDRSFVLLNDTKLNRRAISCSAFSYLALPRMSPLSCWQKHSFSFLLFPQLQQIVPQSLEFSP